LCARCISAARAAPSADGDLDPYDLDVAESMTAEEGYEDALAGEVEWNLEGDGTPNGRAGRGADPSSGREPLDQQRRERARWRHE
jgi:hypothetical protein